MRWRGSISINSLSLIIRLDDLKWDGMVWFQCSTIYSRYHTPKLWTYISLEFLLHQWRLGEKEKFQREGNGPNHFGSESRLTISLVNGGNCCLCCRMIAYCLLSIVVFNMSVYCAYISCFSSLNCLIEWRLECELLTVWSWWKHCVLGISSKVNSVDWWRK